MQFDRNIAIVANPVAAHDRALSISNQIKDILRRKQVSFSFFCEQWPEAFNKFTDVWIVGGDGTLNYFINAYPNINLPLSIFPGGSGNDFRWMLYHDLSLEEQVDFVLQAQPRAVDAGICNGKLFMNGVGIGFDGAVVKDLQGKKMLAGKSSYLLSILKQIIFWKERLCTLAFNTETVTESCFMISIANGQRYGGGFHVAPRADITDNLLDLSIVGRISPLKRLRYLPVMEKGQHLHLPFIKYRQTACVTITAPYPIHAHLDGEYMLACEFIIQCLPGRFSFLW